MRPAIRNELPREGDRVAALHGSEGWYYGPLLIVKVVPSTRVVEARPEFWRHPGTVVFTPAPEEPYPLKWCRWDDLSEAEQREIEGARKTKAPE